MELRQDAGMPAAADAQRSYVGTIVRSMAGRDAKRIFVVVAVEADSAVDGGGYVWLAGRRLRPLERPKRKKLRHLRVLAEESGELAQMIEGGALTNRTLYAYLKKFESMTHELA